MSQTYSFFAKLSRPSHYVEHDFENMVAEMHTQECFNLDFCTEQEV